MSFRVISDRGSIKFDLWCYGEDHLLDRVDRLSDEELDRLWTIAGQRALDDEGKASGRGMLLAKATALAAVEVLEGTPRPLARRRRRPMAGYQSDGN